ncbi:phage portal protein [Bifidobacterium sp. CP2]|uniref:phage portal protein n=1 Tax=Bifidobacterium sp. CP2 TaxID=2809025 RepID=UPI001BDD6D18|nr:phage portal protein [Bifidobacterium sp. CP2]MBT1181206.1 phage portal protein [Bifidobacterium sp. CP2]
MSTTSTTVAPDGILLPGVPAIAAKGGNSPYLDVSSAFPSTIAGVDDADMPTVRELLEVWRAKYPRNLIRSQYALAHEQLKDFGISIPQSIRTKVEAMIGWPAKAVRALADLSVFEGFVFDGADDVYGLNDMCDANGLDVVVPQTITSCYTHSCAFMTASTDPSDPRRVVFQPRSADWSAALWDQEHRCIRAALTITSDDEYGRITGFNVWLPGHVYVCRGDILPWRADRVDSAYQGVAVVPFVYDPQLNRPFGRSRISRSLMALTDMGFRTMVRMEASAEFYSVPKLWFLGADRDAFSADTWSSLISSINAISKDEDDDVPTLQQITQASMQPHSDMLKTIALLVASETNLPVNDLGITMDNPGSAEAMAAAERKLTREADRQNKQFGRALRDLMAIGVCLRENLDSPPDDLRKARPVWAPTQEISTTSRADAFSKMAGAQPAFAQTEAGWRYAGFNRADVAQILSAINAQKAGNVLDRLMELNTTTGGGDGGQQPDARPQPGGQAQPRAAGGGRRGAA